MHSIFTRRPQGENACGFFNWVEAETETAFDPVQSVANSDEALRPRRSSIWKPDRMGLH
jgi:hypothetical protein